MSKDLLFFAGKKALSIIREEGLKPGRVQVVTGAAGGPKWLVLYGLNRLLFTRFFAGRSDPLHLIGSSIGAWQFAAASVRDPGAAFDRLKEAYIHQRYETKPTPAEVSRESERVLAGYIGDDEIRQVLAHPFFRPAFVTARCARAALASETPLRQIPALGLAAAGNAVSRASLRLFFQRVLFQHPAADGFWNGLNGFSDRRVTLSQENFRAAVMASGSIPLVMSGVSDIPGAPSGVYRDGGIIDYHMNLPFPCDPDRIVLFPHYIPRIVPGWFDKKITWRKPVPAWLDNVLLAAPSPDFVAGLPYGKISDRNDFKLLHRRDEERFRYWETVAGQSRLLADDFEQAVASGDIRDRVRPFDFFNAA
ncbi:MAG: patatin-like phospholipase family protein [Thermodesulfobacteriota bacterium]